MIVFHSYPLHILQILQNVAQSGRGADRFGAPQFPDKAIVNHIVMDESLIDGGLAIRTSQVVVDGEIDTMLSKLPIALPLVSIHQPLHHQGRESKMGGIII